jgi:ketosteroid isomerase-like protein
VLSMPQANVEVVRAFYAALNRNDLDAVMALCDDGVEWVNPEGAAESGTRVGAVAFREALQALTAGFVDFRCDIEELDPAGDAVAVVARSTGRGRLSGIPFEAVQGHLLTLRGGCITSFRWFQTVDELEEAVAARD